MLLRGRQTQFYIDIIYGLTFSAGFGYLFFVETDPRVVTFQGGLVLGYFLRVWENMVVYEKILHEEVAAEAEEAVAVEVADQLPSATESEVAEKVEERVPEEVTSEIERQVPDEVTAEVEERVQKEMDEQIEDEIDRRIDDEIDDRVAEEVKAQMSDRAEEDGDRPENGEGRSEEGAKRDRSEASP